ncbi:MAG: hypothetical protein GEU83_04480 [Pseudonocardiaceae bacterium]|nr:hypothetical protein [Pseudonocardiaceae bacterium]
MKRRPALTAAVEVLLAAALSAIAVRWWYRGMIVSEVTGGELYRVDGRWWALAVVAATVAGLLLIDAVHRLVLAFRPAACEPDGLDLGAPGPSP